MKDIVIAEFTAKLKLLTAPVGFNQLAFKTLSICFFITQGL